MKVLFHPLFVALALLFPLLLPTTSQAALAVDPATCIECHFDVVSEQDYAMSVHGENACTSCHIDVTDLDAHMSGMVAPQPPDCVRCHKVETAEHYASVHMLNGIGCASCHYDVHVHQPWQGDKRIAVAKCSECHYEAHEDYQGSIHAVGIERGNMDSAACIDCHNLHEVKPMGDPESFEYREFHTRVCLACHSDQEMMARNNVTTVAGSTYLSSFHGKHYRLGYPELVAGCADCHTSHAVRNHEDALSSTHKDNLVATCGACHPGASPLFVKFYSHGDYSDRENYPILYWTFVLMTGLLISVFVVFWIHSLLWMFRGFVENREKKHALIKGHHHEIPDAHKIYRRFTRTHIFMHLLVIISFLGLSLTGLPLKFADQAWARFLMDLYGGAPAAAWWHRVFAVVTFVYFGMALVMSFKFLFTDKNVQGNFFQRLFGPDSLCPNLRDIRDVVGMVRWFFFLGPKPQFERWTYWEKFDFIAVFWGMFAIGGSGLMLWFPEVFGMFLPGWAFNVATIVHSDEALLATGFIFTVHFFNTHGRPEKFPMDFVIFNGEMPKEEFIEERGDQWRRYEELGITEKFVKERPSRILFDFILKGFGFTAVAIGLTLVVLMIIGFLSGSGH